MLLSIRDWLSRVPSKSLCCRPQPRTSGCAVFGGGVSKEVPKVNELIKTQTQDPQDWGPYKKGRSGHRHTQRDDPVRTWGGDGRLHAQEGASGGPALPTPGSGVRPPGLETVDVCCVSPQPVMLVQQPEQAHTPPQVLVHLSPGRQAYCVWPGCLEQAVRGSVMTS